MTGQISGTPCDWSDIKKTSDWSDIKKTSDWSDIKKYVTGQISINM